MSPAGRWWAPFTCPACAGPVSCRDGALDCGNCPETVRVVDGIPRYPVDVDRPAVPALFDALAPIYETPVWFPPIYRVIGGPGAPADDRAAIADRLGAAGGDVLDVACGTGRFTRHVAGEAAFAWGVDVSDGMLRTAGRRAERAGLATVAFARMDAGDLRFESGVFDGVACCWALHLFPDRRTVLEEVERVLTPGGRFAGTTLTASHVLALPGAETWLRRTIGAHLFAPGELRSLLLEAGFTGVELDRRGAALFFRAST